MTLSRLFAVALLIPTIAGASGDPDASASAGADYAQPANTDVLTDGAMTYEVFETSVPHTDLENCPAEFDSILNFCRLTMTDSQLNVFVFSYKGTQVLQAIKHYEIGEDGLSF